MSHEMLRPFIIKVRIRLLSPKSNYHNRMQTISPLHLCVCVCVLVLV